MFKPGDHVLRAGIYRVTHREHRFPHFATLNHSEIFPFCNECRYLVTFEYVAPFSAHMPPHLAQDEDFLIGRIIFGPTQQ